MTDKFLGSGEGGNLSNGTVSIYGSKIGAKNLDPSRAIKTDSQGRLQTTDLDIADVNNLQSILDNVLSNPFTPPIGQQFVVNGEINCDDLETNNYFSINDEIARTEYISKTLGETTISSNLYTNDIRCSDVKNQIGTTRIDFTDPEDINIQCTELLLNGVPLTTGGAGSELTQDLSIGSFDITNIPQYNGLTSLREIALDTQNIQSSVPSVETVFNNVLKCTGKMINEGLSVTNPTGQNDMSGTLLHDGNIELYGNINLNNNNITGFGFGGTQTLQALNNTVGLHGSDINALKEKTFNISNVVNDTSTEFIGDILSSSLSNSSLGSLTKQFENLFLSGLGIMGSLTTTTGNVIHRLTGTKSFSIGDDSTPFGVLYFSVGITEILSQIKHVFSNGLEPFITGVGSLGSTLKRFNTLWVDSVNGLTPVGGLYAGTSFGTVINGGVLGSLLPNSGVGSLSVPANGFKVGDSFHLVCSGSIPVGDKDDIFTITLNQNGIELGQIVVDMEDMTNASFELEADFQVHSIGVSGQFVTSFDFTFNRTLLKNFSGTRIVQVSFVNTTLPTNLSLTGQFSGQLNSSIITALFYLRKQY